MLTFIKQNEYKKDYFQWYQSVFNKVFSEQSLAKSAFGIPLQICDVFVQELNKADSEISLENMAELLHPFLLALGQIPNKEVKERIQDNVFKPLLENNKTIRETSDDEEELAKREHYHRHIDGGKLPPKTQKEIQQMLNQKYIFNGFNILIYAQNYILKMASSSDENENEKVLEENRETLYKLYEYALELEPKPERDELTFAQQ